MVSAPPARASSAVTTASGAKTAAMPPSAGSACVRRPRSVTRRSASSSGSMPATQAAAYSPRLWPITATGSMPQERQSAASAYSMAKVVGCA